MLASGARLGPYEVVSAAGAGGMGEVYKARDTRLDRTVAIKVLPAHLASDPSLRSRFEREARAVAALNHPHICTLHDIGCQDGVDFLVMEYLEGETLADRLKKGPLPLDHALRHAIEIGHGLDKAHRAGIVHRDLKPGNIMLTKSGAKILDFGLAKAGAAPVFTSAAPGGPAGSPDHPSMLPTTPPGVTVAGTVLGTFQYMAPEQIEGRDADARADIFAFGAVLYEMLTGRKAFEGKSAASLIGAILEREPPPVSALRPLTPPILDHIVSRCLAKDPELRWQSAADVTSELQWVAQNGSTITAIASHAPDQRRPRAPWIVTAGAVVAATGSIATIWYMRPAPPGSPPIRFELATPNGDLVSFALSLDGRQLVFAANGAQGSQLWLRPLDDTVARPLAGTEGATYPFWSPDGRSIGFFADAKLKRIDLAGGAPTVLAGASAPRGGTWSPDGSIVFAPTTGSALQRVSASGGPVQAFTRLAPGQASHRWPQFLPDGRHFLFSTAVSRTDVNGIWFGSLDGSEPKRIMPGETAAVFAPPDRLLVARLGVLSMWRFDPSRGTIEGEPTAVAQNVGDSGVQRGAFSVSATGVLAHRAGGGQRRRLAWFDRTGRMLGAIGEPEDTSLASPELDADNRQAVVFRQDQSLNNDIWVIDLSRAVATRLTFDSGNDTSPLWSPDGRRIVFGAARSAGQDLYEKPSNGAGAEQLLLSSTETKVPLSWSRDGRILLYRSNSPKTGLDLWALPLGADKKPFPVLQTMFDESEGQFSPDGRWIAYVSNESGRPEVYVQPFPGPGGKWQVSTIGGTWVRWRADGRELYYVAPDRRLMAVSISLPADGQAPNVGPPVALFTPLLATGSNTGSKPQYAVASDGRFLLDVAVDDANQSPITIVVNWNTGRQK